MENASPVPLAKLFSVYFVDTGLMLPTMIVSQQAMKHHSSIEIAEHDGSPLIFKHPCMEVEITKGGQFGGGGMNDVVWDQ